ncbi:MAG: PH domain-containing protein [Tidjanibacter sp.]|nr:PH domain-containing protein [Tidjanibacter sp.]
MREDFRYGHYDRTVWYLTALTIVVPAALTVVVASRNPDNSYLAAWLVLCFLTVLLLLTISAPVRIRVTDHRIELRGVLKSTFIEIADITDVRTIRRHEIRSKIPLWGVFGYFGYFGCYIDLRDGRLYRLSVTSRNRLVLITTSRGRYIVSSRQPNLLAKTILAQKEVPVA